MKRLKDRHIIAHLGKISRAGQTGRTGTDHCNLLSFALLRSLGPDMVLSRPVGNETLQLTDRKGFALDPADTLSFTLALLRAHTAADSRKR